MLIRLVLYLDWFPTDGLSISKQILTAVHFIGSHFDYLSIICSLWLATRQRSLSFACLNLIYWQSIGAFFFLLALLTSISITRTCNDQLLLLFLLPITQVLLVATANEDSRLAVTSSTELCEPPSLIKRQQSHWNVFFAFWSAVSCGYGLGNQRIDLHVRTDLLSSQMPPLRAPIGFSAGSQGWTVQSAPRM